MRRTKDVDRDIRVKGGQAGVREDVLERRRKKVLLGIQGGEWYNTAGLIILRLSLLSALYSTLYYLYCIYSKGVVLGLAKSERNCAIQANGCKWRDLERLPAAAAHH